jgi:hypothetical protein
LPASRPLRIALALLLAGLAALLAVACGHEPPAPAPAASAASVTALPVPSASPSSPASTTAVQLDGIFPPHWQLGQRWRLRMASPGLGNGYIMRPFEYVVAAIPDERQSRYVLHVKGEGIGARFVLEFFPDGSFKSARPAGENDSARRVAGIEQRFPGDWFLGGPLPGDGGWPVLYYPAPPPGGPRGPLAEAMAPTPRRQHVESTADGIIIRAEELDALPQRRLTWTWRRGDPWWSTLREEDDFSVTLPDGGAWSAGATTALLGELVR